MSDDIQNLQEGRDAKFNAHIDTLQRLNDIKRRADMFSTQPTGQSLFQYYMEVNRIETIMWSYMTNKEREEVNKLRPLMFSPMRQNSTNGKPIDNFTPSMWLQINNWERLINKTIAHRGLELKSGDNPSSAILK